MQDEWKKVNPDGQLVKFTYSELPDRKAFLTAQSVEAMAGSATGHGRCHGLGRTNTAQFKIPQVNFSYCT